MIKIPDLKCAIFDMDGTLLDSMWMWRNVLVEYLYSLNLSNGEEIVAAVENMYFQQAANYVAGHCEIGMTGEELEKNLYVYIHDIYRQDKRIIVKPGVPEFLKSLKENGCTVCLATLTDRDMVETVLKRFDLFKYFDYIQTVREIGRGKEHPDIFEDCLSFSGCSKSDAVVFEDAAYCLKTAHNAGFRTCGIRDPWQHFEPGAKAEFCDWFIEDFKALAE